MATLFLSRRSANLASLTRQTLRRRLGDVPVCQHQALRRRLCTTPTTAYDDFLDAAPLLPSEQETWRPKATWTGFDDSKLVVKLTISELGLKEVEQQFLEALAGPRVKEGCLQVVVRVEGGYDVHRAKMSQILNDLVEESKKLAAEHPKGPE